jgi:hypothetical protein
LVQQREWKPATSSTKHRDRGSGVIHYVEPVGQNVHSDVGRPITNVADGGRCVGFSIDNGRAVAIQIGHLNLVSDLVHCNCIGRDTCRHGGARIRRSVNHGDIAAV